MNSEKRKKSLADFWFNIKDFKPNLVSHQRLTEVLKMKENAVLHYKPKFSLLKMFLELSTNNDPNSNISFLLLINLVHLLLLKTK